MKGGTFRAAAGRLPLPIVSGVLVYRGAVKGALVLLAGFAALECLFLAGERWFPGE